MNSSKQNGKDSLNSQTSKIKEVFTENPCRSYSIDDLEYITNIKKRRIYDIVNILLGCEFITYSDEFKHFKDRRYSLNYNFKNFYTPSVEDINKLKDVYTEIIKDDLLKYNHYAFDSQTSEWNIEEDDLGVTHLYVTENNYTKFNIKPITRISKNSINLILMKNDIPKHTDKDLTRKELIDLIYS